MKIKVIPHEYLGQFSKSFWVKTDDGIVSIDAGLYRGAKLIAQEGNPHAVLLTHGHFDHVGACPIFKKAGALIYAHKGDEPILYDINLQWKMLYSQFEPDFDIPKARRDLFFEAMREPVVPDRFLEEGDELYGFKVIHTPGHSDGGVSFYNEKEGIIFTGDTFSGNGFFTVLPQINDTKKYMQSIEKVRNLEVSCAYSAHGYEAWDGPTFKKKLDEGMECTKRLMELTEEFIDRENSMGGCEAHSPFKHEAGNMREIKIGKLVEFLCKSEGDKGIGSGAFIAAAACLNNGEYIL